MTGFAALLLGTGCDRNLAGPRAPVDDDRPAIRDVEVYRVVETPRDVVVRADGFLAAWEQATLSAKVGGRVHDVPVDLGLSVRKGQLLAQLDRRDYELRVRQAEAFLSQARVRLGLPPDGSDDRVDIENTSAVRQSKALLTEAEGNRERLLRLSKQGIAPQSELDSVEAAYQVALSRHEEALQETHLRQAIVAQRRAELDIARQELADTSIYAPFDGVIEARRANLGEFINAGAPVVTLVRMNPLRLRLDLAEVDAPRVKNGQTVWVRFQGATNRFSGEVKRLSPVIDEVTRMLRIEADVANDGMLRPGTYVTGEIVVGKNPRAIWIPRAALILFAGMEKVFVAENGKAIERSVQTGRSEGDRVEIVGGLAAGMLIVLSPGNLQDGQPIAVMN